MIFATIDWNVFFVGMPIFFILGLLFWLGSRETTKLYKDLNGFFKQAQEAQTNEELKKISLELSAYAQKHCWHKHHGNRVREIMAYIHGRLGDAPAVVKCPTKSAPEIIIERRYDDDWKAYIKGEPALWGCGSSWTKAIGDLVDMYPEKFNIKITYPAELEPKES